jgi:hypothetical protein
MRYVIQRRNALGRLEWKGEANNLKDALTMVKEINRDRGRCYRLYPAYIYDTTKECIYRQKDLRGYHCIFVGGSSYSIGEPEYFKSIPAIKNALWRRLDDQRMYPCLDDDAYFECYVGEVGDYPDFVIKVGPRGGMVKENC